MQLLSCASLQDAPNQLWPCRAPTKGRSTCVCSYLLFTCPLTFMSLLKLGLTLCTSASSSCTWDGEEAALKGYENRNYRLWLGPHCSCTCASSQPPHPFQNIEVRERYLMHRGVIFPRVFADLFCIYLKQVGGKAPYRITSILIHDVNKINVLRAQKTFFKSHFLLSMSEKIFFCLHSISLVIPKYYSIRSTRNYARSLLVILRVIMHIRMFE